MKCLYCYQELSAGEVDFHASCSRKFFGSSLLPELDFNDSQLKEMALRTIQSQIAVTGVQPKLSLHLTNGGSKKEPGRFTIVGISGDYILKPPSQRFPQLPEVEDLTMHLAEIAGIITVPHTLIRMKSGQLAYLTKRIDRKGKSKIHMEDMCQLTEKLTEHKYHASYEQIAKAIMKYSLNPGLDVVNFAEIVLFSFLTGNADMHLKNFSLIYQPANGPVLSAAYDLLSTVLVNPADDEDLALTLNGKKKKLNRNDFEVAFRTMRLDAKQQGNVFSKMEKAKSRWIEFIRLSFVSPELREKYIQLINDRFERLMFK